MKKKFAKRFLSWVMAAAMVISMLPLSAMAAAPGENVAEVNGTGYSTLGAAIDAATVAANDGATEVEITVLQSCDLDKSITVPRDKTFTLKAAADADVTITDTGRFGMTLDGSFTMENITFITNGQIALNGKDGIPSGREITFRNVTLKMDGKNYAFVENNGYYCAAIFADTPSLFVFDHCNVEIKNYYVEGQKGGAAIRWNGTAGDTGYGIIIQNGTTLESTNCYTGFDGTYNILIDGSTVNVHDHRGNGSNGSHFDIKNNSKVYFNNNKDHGLSAGKLTIDNSTVITTGNGANGIHTNNVLTIKNNSNILVEDNVCGTSSKWTIPGAIHVGAGESSIDSTSSVTVKNNQGSGLLLKSGSLTIQDGAKITITNNEAKLLGYGGGINNRGILTLPSNATIYNNHAATAGDDIYNDTTANESASVTFGKVDSNWVLDDCEHIIDGWYDDAESTRWEAHADTEAGETNHIAEFTDFDESTGLATVTGLTALKAAHGKDAVDKVSYPGLDKQVMDNDDQSWEKDSVGAEAGETINFKLTSNVPEDLTNYLKPDPVDPPEITTRALPNSGEYILTFHDVMHKNLEDPDNFNVVLDREGTEKDVELNNGQYILKTSNLEDSCTFEIELDLAALYEAGVITDEDIAKSTPIVVTYTATLNKDVVTGTYPNTAWVTYEGGETEEDTVNVKTYAIKIFKYDQADESKGLAGAEFELYQKDAEGNPINVIKLTSGNDGYITKGGLDDGRYYLKETKAPDGYVKSDTELPITIDTDTSTDAPISVKFANSLIPHTGGMGTTLFSIVGGTLIATAGVVYFISRRKKSHTA